MQNQEALIVSKQSDIWCLRDLVPLNVQVLEHFIQEVLERTLVNKEQRSQTA